MKIVTDPNNEGTLYSVESDVKNQNKTTIKIKSSNGKSIALRIDEPEHCSNRKEMARGRLLFYVSFKGGKGYLDRADFGSLLNI